jgi:LmbE family N-acetylglucosaminyl deacetylase
VVAAGRTLLAVVAHPDDDAWEVAAPVALHADDPGLRFVLVHATDGAAGSIAPGSGATRETLGAVRRLEDVRGWRAVGREPDRHEWLDLPDGAVADTPYDQLLERIASLLTEERPDVVLTFGPDGATGHPDHIVVGRATDEAFARFAGDGGPGFRRLLHFGMEPETWASWNDLRSAAGLAPFDPTQLYHPRPSTEPLDVVLDASSVAARIEAGLREHRTQAEDTAGPEWRDGDLRRLLSRAVFVQAWPPPLRTGPPLLDVFEGL